MIKSLEIIAGVLISLSICFNIVCVLDIFEKRKKPIYEFDCEFDGMRYHISVLEKFQHHFSVETFRRLRVEYTFTSDTNGVCYGAYETIVDESGYIEYLKNITNQRMDIHA